MTKESFLYIADVNTDYMYVINTMKTQKIANLAHHVVKKNRKKLLGFNKINC
jgi:hypothetical protein